MINTKKFARILDICLKRVLVGEESIATVLADYPQYREKLRDEIEAALWLHRKRIETDPRPGFVASSRSYVLSQLEIPAQNALIAKKKTVKIPGLQIRWMLSSLVLLVIYVGSLAVFMDRSLPGDRLYSFKTSMEDLRLVLTLDLEEDARLHRMYAQDHLIACAMAISQGRYADAEIALHNYERSIAGLSRAVQMISESPTDHPEWQYIDVSQIYLQDFEIFQVLLPGAF